MTPFAASIRAAIAASTRTGAAMPAAGLAITTTTITTTSLRTGTG